MQGEVVQGETVQGGKALRNLLIGIFCLVFLFHIPALYHYTKTRHDIERRYDNAAWAKRLVERAAVAGSLSSLPAETSVGPDRIYISTDTGVVTVSFGGVPEGTLKMLPIVQSGGKNYALSVYIDSGRPVEKGSIFWACSSSLLRSLEPYIQENPGTLASEFAPPECRYVTWLGLKSEASLERDGEVSGPAKR